VKNYLENYVDEIIWLIKSLILSLFDKEKTLEVKFPFTVTNEIVDKLLKLNDESGPPMGMYILKL
jgi:hypothetical protein